MPNPSSQSLTVRKLDDLLAASAATPEFKAAVRALADKQSQNRIAFNPGSPPVKVLRLTMKLLEEAPEIAFESLQVRAASGCSDFTGEAVAQPGNVRVEFSWDCRWRAIQQGWKDPFGDPDQIRAAREFGYQCFEKLCLTRPAGD